MELKRSLILLKRNIIAQNLMLFIFTWIIFWTSPLTGGVGTHASPAMDEEHQRISEFLEELSQEPIPPEGHSQTVHRSRSAESFRELNWRGGPTDPRGVQITRQALALLAQMAVGSVGTPSQGAFAQALDSASNGLSTSSAATLASASPVLAAEAAAIGSGDAQGAATLAGNLEGGATGDALGSPSPDDAAWQAQVQSWETSLADSAAQTFGSLALNSLANWISGGGTSAGATTNPYSQALVSVLGSGIESAPESKLGSSTPTLGTAGSLPSSWNVAGGAQTLAAPLGGGSAAGGALPAAQP